MKEPGGDEKKDEDKKKEEERRRSMRQIGAFTGIPFLLLSGMFAGWGLGYLLDKWLHTGAIGIAACILLGIAAAFREVFNLLKDL